MAIIYSKSAGLNNGAIGKLETPIKMVIEHESDLLTKQGGIRDWLFNVEKSSRFGETILGGNEFGTFQAAEEGSGAENDSIQETYKKFIEHVQFMKEFTITAAMMEDANYGIAADGKRRAENFTRAYYKTQHQLCEFVLSHGTASTATFNRAVLDLTTGDNLPLFSTAHTFGTEGDTQSNKFWANLADVAAIEEYLAYAAARIRNMKDENGMPLGYTADTIILPGNRPLFEMKVKKVCGSDGALGNGYNDINIQYGNWHIVVLPTWQATSDVMLVMSSEANKNLCGNMFFNRIPLTVSNWVDNHTGNYIWNGRCRFGVGFGTYKHIILVEHNATALDGYTAL